jgi:hypothetical protein
MLCHGKNLNCDIGLFPSYYFAIQTAKEGQGLLDKNKEGVALNSNNFVLSKESVLVIIKSKAADFNGRPLDCRILGFFTSKPLLKMLNLDHDATESAVTAAYFEAFLVKEN